MKITISRWEEDAEYRIDVMHEAEVGAEVVGKKKEDIGEVVINSFTDGRLTIVVLGHNQKHIAKLNLA